MAGQPTFQHTRAPATQKGDAMSSPVRNTAAINGPLPVTTTTSTSSTTPTTTTGPTPTGSDPLGGAEVKNYGERRSNLAQALNELRQAIRFSNHKGNPNAPAAS